MVPWVESRFRSIAVLIPCLYLSNIMAMVSFVFSQFSDLFVQNSAARLNLEERSKMGNYMLRAFEICMRGSLSGSVLKNAYFSKKTPPAGPYEICKHCFFEEIAVRSARKKLLTVIFKYIAAGTALQPATGLSTDSSTKEESYTISYL